MTSDAIRARLALPDYELFRAVELIGWKTACRYNLPLHTIQPAKHCGENNAFGLCTHRGKIYIVLRRRAGVFWKRNPLSAIEILDTLAHELAHLRHFSHGRRWRKLYRRIARRLLDSDNNFVSAVDKLRKSN